VLVEVAGTLVGEFEVLQMVTSRAAEPPGAAAAGLLLTDHHGQPQFMAASDEQAELLGLQVQAHGSPCQDSDRQGIPVVGADLSAGDPRWPQSAPRAVAAGFGSVR